MCGMIFIGSWHKSVKILSNRFINNSGRVVYVSSLLLLYKFHKVYLSTIQPVPLAASSSGGALHIRVPKTDVSIKSNNFSN